MVASTKNQAVEIKEVNCLALGRGATKKRGAQNAGITLWFAENKGDKKTI